MSNKQSIIEKPVICKIVGDKLVDKLFKDCTSSSKDENMSSSDGNVSSDESEKKKENSNEDFIMKK